MTAVAPTVDPDASQPRRPRFAGSPRRVLAALLLAGVLVDLAVMTRASGAAATIAFLVVAAGLAAALLVGPDTGLDRGRRAATLVLLGAVAVLSVFLFLRSSPWLVAIDVAAIGVLLAWAASVRMLGAPFDTRISQFIESLASCALSTIVAPGPVVATVHDVVPRRGGRRGHLRAVLRGGLIAAPIVIVVWVALASADPVFASMLSLDLDLGPAPLHLIVVVVAVWAVAGLFVQSTRTPATRPGPGVSVGAVEGLVVMGSLVAIYSVFAVSRLLVASRGASYVTESTGLTYAEYARSGFFQLLGIAALTALVLLALRALVRRDTRGAGVAVGAMGVVASALTLVVVHSALVRLHLYEDAFGLTHLRYFSAAFAWLLAAVFVLVGLSFVVDGLVRREWLPTAIVAAAMMTLVVVNVDDPDRTIAEHNLDRAAQGLQFDPFHASSLSSDAVPTLVASLDVIPLYERRLLVPLLCADHELESPLRWNVSSWKADSSLDQLCGG